MSQDLHKITAARMFKISEDEVSSEQRRVAKRRNFVRLYSDHCETPEQEKLQDELWVKIYESEKR